MMIWSDRAARPAATARHGGRAGRTGRTGRWLAIAVATLLVPIGLAQADLAQAEPGRVIATQGDPRGDVTLLATDPGAPSPSKAALSSIDLRAFTLVEQTGGVRMTVKLRRILTTSAFDQIVEVQMKPADSAETWFLDVAMSGQKPTASMASYSEDLSGDISVCKPLTARVNSKRDTVSLFVPDQCLPTDDAKIRVYSSLGNYPGGGAGYSLDKLRVRGSYLMHP